MSCALFVLVRWRAVTCDVATYGLTGLPELSFHFGTHMFPLKPEDYVIVVQYQTLL